MNLPVFFQTAATLSPILLAGTAFTFKAMAAPKTGVGSAVRGLLVVVPPFLVMWYSLSVLAGVSSAETWRVPVLVLLYFQVATGILGTGDYVYVGKADAVRKPLLRKPLLRKPLLRKPLLRKPLLRKPRPRRQPQAPEETVQDEMRQPEPAPHSDAPSADAQGPDETPAPDCKS